MARKNLISNPSFRGGIVGYAGINGASIALSGTRGFYGPESLLVTKANTFNSGVETDPVPVTAGLPYAFSVYVQVPAIVPTVPDASLSVSAVWLGADDQILSQSVSTISTVEPANSWTRLTGTATAPTGATQAKLVVAQLAAGPADAIFYLDALLLEQSTFVGGYLDNISRAEQEHIINLALAPKAQSLKNTIELNADVALGDLILNTIDEDGTVWICEDIDGWWTPAEGEIPDISRGNWDGSYDVSGRNLPRIMTLTGSFLVSDASKVPAARNRLISALNIVRQGTWLRTNEEPTKASFVRRSGRPSISTINARGRTMFSIGLKAADPIKYEWNDQDPDGYTTEVLTSEDGEAVADIINGGTTEVTATFTIEGPLGVGSTIYNAATNETITLSRPLRGAGALGTVISRELVDNVITITTDAAHAALVGDRVVVSSVGPPFDAIDEVLTVTAVSKLYPYTISYAREYPDIAAEACLGSVALVSADTLEIDTYNGTVSFNGDVMGARSRVETLVDWIKLAPGSNSIAFKDEPSYRTVESKKIDADVVTLTTDTAHFLAPGDRVVVDLPVEATLAEKTLSGNKVTLTTTTDHGFSLGDRITVNSTEDSVITNKVLTGNVATLTTEVDGGFSIGDSISVDLGYSAALTAKAAAANVVTLSTDRVHGFSVGDIVTVALPSTATPISKSLAFHQARITTSGAHNFSKGDRIFVDFSDSAIVRTKYTNGLSVVLTTTAPHGFARGDQVSVSFPTTATPITRAIDRATGLVTLTTSSTHNFSVGDRIDVSLAIPPASVTTRSATTTTCTLTTATPHKFAVGERILVSGVSARYNANVLISAVTSTTLSYSLAGASEASTGSAGSVLNTTIRDAYEGAKIIETIPNGGTLTYLDAADDSATTTSSSISGGGATIHNDTNAEISGTFSLTSVSEYQITYRKDEA